MLEYRLLSLSADLEEEILLEDVFDEDGNILLSKGTLINEYTLDILKKSNMEEVSVYPSVQRYSNISCEQIALEYKECRLILQNMIIKMALGKGVNPKTLGCIFEPLAKEINQNREMIGYTNNIKDNDEYTYNHSINVAVYSLFIGCLLNLDKEELSELSQAALLHDLGKSNIPYEVLNKKGKLTKEEFELVKKHPLDGYRLSKDMPSISEKVRNAILCHHEREDGSGYPCGIKGEEINLYAKIIAIADVYDALISERVYKEKSTPFQAIEEFYNMGSEKFDTHILNLFSKNIVQLYVNSKVELNNGRVGKIECIHPKRITQPVVNIDGNHLKLWEENSLEIKEIIG